MLALSVEPIQVGFHIVCNTIAIYSRMPGTMPHLSDPIEKCLYHSRLCVTLCEYLMCVQEVSNGSTGEEVLQYTGEGDGTRAGIESEVAEVEIEVAGSR